MAYAQIAYWPEDEDPKTAVVELCTTPAEAGAVLDIVEMTAALLDVSMKCEMIVHDHLPLDKCSMKTGEDPDADHHLFRGVSHPSPEKLERAKQALFATIDEMAKEVAAAEAAIARTVDPSTLRFNYGSGTGEAQAS